MSRSLSEDPARAEPPAPAGKTTTKKRAAAKKVPSPSVAAVDDSAKDGRDAQPVTKPAPSKASKAPASDSAAEEGNIKTEGEKPTGATAGGKTKAGKNKRGRVTGKVEDGGAGILHQMAHSPAGATKKRSSRARETVDDLAASPAAHEADGTTTAALPLGERLAAKEKANQPSSTGDDLVVDGAPTKKPTTKIAVAKNEATDKPSNPEVKGGRTSPGCIGDESAVGGAASTTSKAPKEPAAKKQETSKSKKQNTVKPDKKAAGQSKISDHFFVRRSARIVGGKGKSTKSSTNDRMVEELLAGAALDCIESFNAEEKGLGVRATALIRKNRVVIEYNGDLLDFEDAVKREEEYAKDPSIGCYMYFILFKNKKYCVDATYAKGNGRLVNHSKKKANLQTRLLDHDGSPRLVLVSTCDISPGTELLYDYGDRRKSATTANEWLAN